MRSMNTTPETEESPTSGNPSLAQPMSGLLTATTASELVGEKIRLRGRQLSRALCVIQLKIHGNYRSGIYSVATVILRAKERP